MLGGGHRRVVAAPVAGIAQRSWSVDIFAAMKKLLFLGACLVALASQPVKAQTGGADVVVARFYYEGGRLYVAIARGAAEPEIQDMRGSEAAEAQFCQKVVAKLYQEGFSLKSTFSSGPGYKSTLVFAKGQ